MMIERTDAEEQAIRTVPFLEAVAAEREYQRRKWGDSHDDDHQPDTWARLLLWYGGEVAAQMEGSFGHPEWTDDDPERCLRPIRASAVKLAAICGAMVESIDRAIARCEADE